MATKKETVTEEIVETAVQEEAPAKETPVAKKAVARKFAPDDMITCRSITYGELLLTGTKSKLLYSWANYGDTTEVEFQDLQALKSTRSSYLFRPRFVIEDEELIAQWGKDFGDMYKDIVHTDVEDLFKLPLNQFKAKLKKSPKGVQQAVKNIAGEKIMNGSLDSLSKIKAIDEILGTDLKLYLA
jgi:hypothetical protein